MLVQNGYIWPIILEIEIKILTKLIIHNSFLPINNNFGVAVWNICEISINVC